MNPRLEDGCMQRINLCTVGYTGDMSAQVDTLEPLDDRRVRLEALAPLGGGKVTTNDYGCWIYGPRPDRYVTIPRVGQIHRWAYSMFRCQVPEDLIVHHRCKVRACFNPEHLAMVSVRVHNCIHVAEADRKKGRFGTPTQWVELADEYLMPHVWEMP